MEQTWTKPMDLQSFSSLGVAHNPGRFGGFSVAAVMACAGWDNNLMAAICRCRPLGGTGIPIGIPWDLGK